MNFDRRISPGRPLRDHVLPFDFYDRPVEQVARDLLHCLLVRRTRRGLLVGRIVETEAYLSQGDSACHAARGMTPRNVSMFGSPGRAYVYAIHSRWCFNVVSEARGVPAAVLIRSVVPLVGLGQMSRNRKVDSCRDLDLARGPARLCEAFSINKQLDSHDLTSPRRLWIADRSAGDFPVEPSWSVGQSPRIGVTSAEHLELRYFVDGSAYVSGPRKWHSTAVRVE